MIEVKAGAYAWTGKRRTAVVARGLKRYVSWIVGRPGRWGPFDEARRMTWR